MAKERTTAQDPKDAARAGGSSSGGGSSKSSGGGSGKGAGSQSASHEERPSVKGGRHSHQNDPFPPKEGAMKETDPGDPTDAARKGGQHSHSGRGSGSR